MLSINSFDQIYFYRPYIDFRKGIYGLSAIVQDEMQLNPFGKYLFLFSNSRRNKIKALYWDKTGFALWIKYLETDKFMWPSHIEDPILRVDLKKLKDFLIGFDPWQVPHEEKKFQYT